MIEVVDPDNPESVVDYGDTGRVRLTTLTREFFMPRFLERDEAEREAFVKARRTEYEADVDLLRLASELVIDAVVKPEGLRPELIERLARAGGKDRHFSDRRHGVPPV